MILLSIVTIIFFLVIGVLIYRNWPAGSTGRSCGGCGRCGRCQEKRKKQRPCGRCGKPAATCPCHKKKGGCPFC